MIFLVSVFISVNYTLGACVCAGVHFRQAQTKEKAENNQEREGEGMDTEEEGTHEEKRKYCAARYKIHRSQTKGSLLIPFECLLISAEYILGVYCCCCSFVASLSWPDG